MLLLQPNPLLWTAIEQRRIIRLLHHGKNRILEPHDHGILNDSKTDEITQLELLDQYFPGGRPTASGKRRKWGELFIRVSRRHTLRERPLRNVPLKNTHTLFASPAEASPTQQHNHAGQDSEDGCRFGNRRTSRDGDLPGV
jgi:hypothetical protein